MTACNGLSELEAQNQSLDWRHKFGDFQYLEGIGINVNRIYFHSVRMKITKKKEGPERNLNHASIFWLREGEEPVNSTKQEKLKKTSRVGIVKNWIFGRKVLS